LEKYTHFVFLNINIYNYSEIFKMNTKNYRLLILATLLLFTGMAQASVYSTNTPDTIILSIDRITQTGNSVDIGIGISGLGSAVAPSLSTYDLDLDFDPTYLSFARVEYGDSLLGNQLDLFNLGSNPASAELTSPGVVNLFEVSGDSVADLNSLQASSFILATVTFDVLNAGASQLELVSNALGDAGGNSLAHLIVAPATITTVPLPPAFFMMFSGLFTILATKKNLPNQI
jgi:hypothetical protein